MPNKRQEEGGWKTSKNQIAGGILISGGDGGLGKSQFLCKMKYKLFNVDYLQSKEYKGKE